MKKRVWLFCIFISGLAASSCAIGKEAAKPAAKVPLEQDTLEMEPDFSYVVPLQQPHILIDQSGYQSKDKKAAFFYGEQLEESFEIRDAQTEEVVYSGTLSQIKEDLYLGIFTDFTKTGKYYIHQKQVGDSYSFSIDPAFYRSRYKKLESALLKEKPALVSEQAYLLAGYMFIGEMFSDMLLDGEYIHTKIEELLSLQEEKTGAFYSEIMKNEGEVSLSTTAQVAGVLAQYAYLYQDTEEPAFINTCLQASQKAYHYIEKYRDNTDSDAWYFAAVQLYRLTRQYKYQNAVIEYDTLPVESRSSTDQGYTIFADFTYLRIPHGTDYDRCALLLDQYLDQTQSISMRSSREYFYVQQDIVTMSDKKILDDMLVLGIVNTVLSGQEYAGVQKNYIHYLSGTNEECQNYLDEKMLKNEKKNTLDVTNAVKTLVIYASLI